MQQLPNATHTQDSDQRDPTPADLAALVDALSDTTRGLLFLLLYFHGEMTASQLASEAKLHLNTIIHHLRVLQSNGLIWQCRTEMRRNFVEKYYQVPEGVRDHLSRSPDCVNEALKGLSPERRQAVFVTLMLTAAALLEQEARHISSMSAEQFQMTLSAGNLLTSMLVLRPSTSEEALKNLRRIIRTKIRRPAMGDQGSNRMMIVASFPMPFPLQSENS